MLQKSILVREADVLVYAATDGDASLENELRSVLPEVFPMSTELTSSGKKATAQNVTLRYYKNPGYQEGAIMAMGDAVANDWFAPYDWIVRLNPDVLIRDDDFLLRTMRNETVDGIFAMCPNPGRVHTDFFAVRPKVIAKKAFQLPKLPPHFTAELQAMD